jgi:pimeloyl-ACP methyl ester carboxylesterase
MPADRTDVVMPPTGVLVHGAFAESASWDRVIEPLQAAGHRVVAAANPLRGFTSDAAAVSDLVRTIDGPVVLVGHSYGGAVTTNVDADAGAFAPEPGESCITLVGMFPGSTLGEALQPVLRSDGATDLSIRVDRFHDQFAADVPTAQAARMTATQRPGHAGGPRRAVRRAPALARAPVVVRVRRGGPQHPGRPRAPHGPARRRPPHNRHGAPRRRLNPTATDRKESHMSVINTYTGVAQNTAPAEESTETTRRFANELLVADEPLAVDEFVARVLRHAHHAAYAHGAPDEARVILHVAQLFADELAKAHLRFDRLRFIEAAIEEPT